MKREINHLQKRIRADVISEYLYSIGQNSCVCFTCGNSSKYLRQAGLRVIEVKNTEKWWTFTQIQSRYKMFDATSGHLPMPLMVEISKRMRIEIGSKPTFKNVACGSGETFVCLCLAYPLLKFKPIYGKDEATKFNIMAPLNSLVASLM